VNKHQEQVPFQNRDRQNILVMLEEAQNEAGCVSEATIADVAESLDVSQSEVFGVATFYSFLSVKPLGRNVIRICRSLPCYLKDSPMIIDSIAAELGIKPGETTPDMKFSFELTNCIGACDKAPAMLINSDVHGDLTPQNIAQILKSYD